MEIDQFHCYLSVSVLVPQFFELLFFWRLKYIVLDVDIKRLKP